MIWCRKPLNRGIKRKRGSQNTAILDVSKAISRKRCKIGGKLVLITNRKSHMSFRLVQKSVTLNDLAAKFHYIKTVSGNVVAQPIAFRVV